MNDEPELRLRDSSRKFKELYPFGRIPNEIVLKLAQHLTYLRAVGRNDISGDDWGDAFAHAIEADHLASPLGIVDVAKDSEAWSTKTVKNESPHTASVVRLISGRNSPDYSMGITDPHADIAATGRAILAIWNERISIALDYYKRLRTIVLIRSNDLLSYTLFEEPAKRFDTSKYIWNENRNGNLIARHISDDETITRFTWQPHGSQFTIHAQVPEKARKFTISEPPVMKRDDVLDTIGYCDDWVHIIQ